MSMSHWPTKLLDQQQGTKSEPGGRRTAGRGYAESLGKNRSPNFPSISPHARQTPLGTATTLPHREKDRSQPGAGALHLGRIPSEATKPVLILLGRGMRSLSLAIDQS